MSVTARQHVPTLKQVNGVNGDLVMRGAQSAPLITMAIVRVKAASGRMNDDKAFRLFATGIGHENFDFDIGVSSRH